MAIADIEPRVQQTIKTVTEEELAEHVQDEAVRISLRGLSDCVHLAAQPYRHEQLTRALEIFNNIHPGQEFVLVKRALHINYAEPLEALSTEIAT